MTKIDVARYHFYLDIEDSARPLYGIDDCEGILWSLNPLVNEVIQAGINEVIGDIARGLIDIDVSIPVGLVPVNASFRLLFRQLALAGVVVKYHEM